MQLRKIVQVQEGETIDFTTISKIENVSKKIKTHYPRSAI
jgi:hypothetical protein